MQGLPNDIENPPNHVDKEERIHVGDRQTSLSMLPLLWERLKWLLKWLLLFSYVAYFIAVLNIHSRKDEEGYWCSGDGLLIIINAILVLGVFYYKIIRKYLFPFLAKADIFSFGICKVIRRNKFRRYSKLVTYVVTTGGFIAFVFLDSEDYSKLTPIFGMAVFIVMAALISKSPKHIQASQIFWGIGLQIALALIIVRWDVGTAIFQCLGEKINWFLSFTDKGTSLVFGKDIIASKAYAFAILPVVLFFGMFISIFYYYGIVQWVILKFGWLLEATMGTTPCESMAAVANIFLGQAEAPLVIRPYISQLTKSELHAVLTGGFSTIAGGAMAAYIALGISSAHLISASIMSAPAALALSKIIYPETEESQTASKNIKLVQGEEKSVIHAIMNGILSAIPIIASITACLICFMGLMAFLNSLADWGCQMLDFEEGTCTLELGLGYLLFPIAWLMGIPPSECHLVGYLLGTKMLVSDFLAYYELMVMSNEGRLSERSILISTYALCGFASISSIGNQLASLGSMSPEKKPIISNVIVRAFIAGNMASCLTACIAGALTQESSIQAFSYNVTTHNITS